MSTFPTDVLSVIVKALEPKCFTKFRRTSKEFRYHISDRFQYYQSQRIEELKELVHILVSENCKKTKIIQSNSKLVKEERCQMEVVLKNKTRLACKRLQTINELQIKYELLLTEHNKLQESSGST